MVYGSVTPELTRVMPDIIMRGVKESRVNKRQARTVVSHLLRPALSEIRCEEADWGLSAADVAHTLRASSVDMRAAAVSVLRQWMPHFDIDAENVWATIYGPFFERVWPKERLLQDASATDDLIGLLTVTGSQFPAAYHALKHFIPAYDRARGGNISPLINSGIIEAYPEEALALLWQVCGPASRGSLFELGKVLDAIIAAKPAIEVDRRFQWLEQQAVRYQ